MEEIQLEDNSFWHFFDSSQQLVIDSASKKKHKSIFIFILIYSLIILLISIFAPRSYQNKFIESPITNPHDTFVNSVIDTKELEIYNQTLTVFFAVQRNAHFNNNSNFRKNHQRHRGFYFHHNETIKRAFQIISNIKFFNNNTMYKNFTISIPKLQLPFSHHHKHSDTVKLFDLNSGNTDYIEIDLKVKGNFHRFRSIWYIISIKNPICCLFNQYSCLFFMFQSAIFILYILFTCQRRYEQVFTLIYLFLSLLTSVSCIFSTSHTWKIIPKFMTLYLQLYMFYMVAYVANKQRSIITSLSLILFVISFISDLFSLLLKSEVPFNFSHGHHIFWHHITIAVSISTIAAMRSSIDDFTAFVIYTVCLCINMFAFWTAFDLTFFFPRIQQMINLRFFASGMNSIIMTILFAYHRSMNNDMRRDQKSNSLSMNEHL